MYSLVGRSSNGFERRRSCKEEEIDRNKFPLVHRRVHISILADTRSASKKEALIMKRSGGDTVPFGGNIRRPPLASGSSHATNFHHLNLNPRGTHAPQNETEWWGYCATWGKYKTAALGSGSSYATNFHHSNLNPRGTHAPQNETEWWGYCATWGKYKAAALGSGSSDATNFHEFKSLNSRYACPITRYRIRCHYSDN
ncbi:uncharacterized protein V1477_004240 [Vespula maculifrons]|uniref:Fibrobacter succinogenes major paralogous domain-containing protein n=1 Tax=Vespula maculifrons TaxID=7453 RepID=A0ABD2CR03_VESMC